MKLIPIISDTVFFYRDIQCHVGCEFRLISDTNTPVLNTKWQFISYGFNFIYLLPNTGFNELLHIDYHYNCFAPINCVTVVLLVRRTPERLNHAAHAPVRPQPVDQFWYRTGKFIGSGAIVPPFWLKPNRNNNNTHSDRSIAHMHTYFWWSTAVTFSRSSARYSRDVFLVVVYSIAAFGDWSSPIHIWYLCVYMRAVNICIYCTRRPS